MELSNWRISLIKKLKGTPLRDSAPNGISDTFSETAIFVDDIPDTRGHERKRKRGDERERKQLVETGHTTCAGQSSENVNSVLSKRAHHGLNTALVSHSVREFLSIKSCVSQL